MLNLGRVITVWFLFVVEISYPPLAFAGGHEPFRNQGKQSHRPTIVVVGLIGILVLVYETIPI